MNAASLGTNSKTVVIIGDIELESVYDRITALGHSFKNINPLLEDFNFANMKKYLNRIKNSGKLLAVIIYLSGSLIMDICTSGLVEKWLHLLEELKNGALLISVNEDNLLGLFKFDYSLYVEIRYDNNRSELWSSDFKMFRFKSKVPTKAIVKILEQVDNDVLSSAFVEINLLSHISLEEGGYFSKDIYVQMLKSDQTQYHQRGQQLQSVIKKTNIFLEQIKRDLEEEITDELQRAKHFLQMIQTSGCEIVPYRDFIEITIRVHHFLDELDSGVFFHLYVPNGRYQEAQLASFLRLLESYLQRVEKLQFSIETRRTLRGQVYEFKSKNGISDLTEMENAILRFKDFMSFCQNDHKKAEAVMIEFGLSSASAAQLVTKYTKDYQRLIFDTQQELEQKIFALQQRLKNEAFELAAGDVLPLTQTIQPNAFLSLTNNSGSININIFNPTVYNNPIAESIINGNIDYTSEDKQLIDLFQRYAEGLEPLRLKSELEQLKDTSSPETVRKTAKQKIVGFLWNKVAPAIGQSALTVLTAYLEKLLTGS